MRIQPDIPVRTTIIPSNPPWKPPDLILQPKLTQDIRKEDSIEQKRGAAIETINTRYPEHIHLYTDGSKTNNSTSAGLWIPDFQHREGWKLNQGTSRSIMGAELFGIDKGMTWTLMHKELLATNKIVILTDSRSGIEALMSSTPKHQSFLVDNIKQKAKYLKEDHMEITIQWCPSHVGLQGNTEADSVARLAHNNPQEVITPLDTSEMKKLIQTAQTGKWKEAYEVSKQRGLHLGLIKPNLEKWPWASMGNRRSEVAMTRLRIGHVGLNGHLKRFNLSDSDLCTTCNVIEDVPHYLTACRKYIWSRRKLMTNLAKIGVQQPDHRVLLGGGPYPSETQHKIIKLVGDYLDETGRINTL